MELCPKTNESGKRLYPGGANFLEIMFLFLASRGSSWIILPCDFTPTLKLSQSFSYDLICI